MSKYSVIEQELILDLSLASRKYYSSVIKECEAAHKAHDLEIMARAENQKITDLLKQIKIALADMTEISVIADIIGENNIQ